MKSNLPEYKYNGTRSLVLLHEKYLRSFVQAWKEAKAKNVVLPVTDDPAYVSLEALLRHILRAARGYMTWICDKLELPDPQIDPTPLENEIEGVADDYLEKVIEGWKLPLANVPEEKFNNVFKSRWGVEYCIDAMIEHAVMHPLRHEFQLKNLISTVK
jgi:uncharacterized damage-inducible protein DinB